MWKPRHVLVCVCLRGSGILLAATSRVSSPRGSSSQARGSSSQARLRRDDPWSPRRAAGGASLGCSRLGTAPSLCIWLSSRAGAWQLIQLFRYVVPTINSVAPTQTSLVAVFGVHGKQKLNFAKNFGGGGFRERQQRESLWGRSPSPQLAPRSWLPLLCERGGRPALKFPGAARSVLNGMAKGCLQRSGLHYGKVEECRNRPQLWGGQPGIAPPPAPPASRRDPLRASRRRRGRGTFFLPFSLFHPGLLVDELQTEALGVCVCVCLRTRVRACMG